jgi:hypothetical protein
MSDPAAASPSYPARAWRPLAGLAVSLIAGTVYIFAWRAHADLLPREYLVDYARLQLPPLPIDALEKRWKYDEILNGAVLAIPSESGMFTCAKFTPNSREFFRDWLQKHVYDGKPLWRVLLWPLIATGLTLLSLMAWAVKSHQDANRESRNGRLLRGPRLVTHREWNRCTKAKEGFWIETR